MRMKKLNLSPSCVFVHQSISDVTAGEKDKEGRRRLQEKLDEMERKSIMQNISVMSLNFMFKMM